MNSDRKCNICGNEIFDTSGGRVYCEDCSPSNIPTADRSAYLRKVMIKKAREIHNDECFICGYDKCSQALEFHHVLSEDKEFGLATKTTTWSKYVKEINKCVLVCANCHREIHFGMIGQDKLVNNYVFDCSYIKERAKTIITCSECGIELSDITNNKTGKCRDCYNKTVGAKSKPTKEELSELIFKKSFVEIGKMYGISDNAIRKWCKKFGLPHTKKLIKELS